MTWKRADRSSAFPRLIPPRARTISWLRPLGRAPLQKHEPDRTVDGSVSHLRQRDKPEGVAELFNGPAHGACLVHGAIRAAARASGRGAIGVAKLFTRNAVALPLFLTVYLA